MELVLREQKRFLGPKVKTPLEIMRLIMPGLEQYVASGEGDGRAHWHLSTVLQGFGTPDQRLEAEKHAREAAGMGVEAAAEHIGKQFGALLNAAEDGDPEAQFKLAELNTYGWGCARSISQSIKWYLEASKSGNAEAQYRVALFYLDGVEIAADRPEGLRHLVHAAEMGHEAAVERLKEEGVVDITVRDHLAHRDAGVSASTSTIDQHSLASRQRTMTPRIDREPIEHLVRAYLSMLVAIKSVNSHSERRTLSEAITEQRRGIFTLMHVPEQCRSRALQILEDDFDNKVTRLLVLAESV